MFSRSNKGNNKCPDEIFVVLKRWQCGLLAGVICPICKNILSMNLYEEIDDPNIIKSLCYNVSSYLTSITGARHHPTNNNWTRICKQNLGIQNEIARIIDCHTAKYDLDDEQDFMLEAIEEEINSAHANSGN